MGLVLAAGASRRMGSPKALVQWGGEVLLERAVRLLLDQGAAQEVVVVVADSDELVRESVDLPIRARFVANSAPSRGQSSSVRVGARALPRGAEAVLLPVDHAPVEEETVRQLSAAFDARSSDVSIVVPSFEGRRGHPAYFDAIALGELAELSDDEPAHAVVRRDAARLHHESVQDPAVCLDLDRPDDLLRLRAERARRR